MPPSTAGPQPVDRLRLFRRESGITVLGPGTRAVVWVQGCPLACPMCSVPESWDNQGGFEVSAESLANWVLAQTGIEGITLSGGEPMEQAAGLSALTGLLDGSGLGVICYTGYRYEHLSKQGTASQRALLARIDLLIDGPYLESLHADLLWRGSSNQRLIALSARYADFAASVNSDADRSAGIQVTGDSEGIAYAGVPPVRGFRASFLEKASEFGLALRREPKGEHAK
jgi:anaerobic ribonucleoside-triphosphate reductase activating protein